MSGLGLLIALNRSQRLLGLQCLYSCCRGPDELLGWPIWTYPLWICTVHTHMLSAPGSPIVCHSFLFFLKVSSRPNVGLEVMTPRSRVTPSTQSQPGASPMTHHSKQRWAREGGHLCHLTPAVMVKIREPQFTMCLFCAGQGALL